MTKYTVVCVILIYLILLLFILKLICLVRGFFKWFNEKFTAVHSSGAAPDPTFIQGQPEAADPDPVYVDDIPDEVPEINTDRELHDFLNQPVPHEHHTLNRSVARSVSRMMSDASKSHH